MEDYYLMAYAYFDDVGGSTAQLRRVYASEREAVAAYLQAKVNDRTPVLLSASARDVEIGEEVWTQVLPLPDPDTRRLDL